MESRGPVQERLLLYNNVRERIGGVLTLEWEASPQLYLRVFGTRNCFKDKETRDENWLEQVGKVINQTRITGTFVSTRNVINLNPPFAEQRGLRVRLRYL